MIYTSIPPPCSPTPDDLFGSSFVSAANLSPYLASGASFLPCHSHPTTYLPDMSEAPDQLDRPDSAKGKARASPERQPAQQIDFEFLNFSHPSDAKASQARRTVRSHVTRQQHYREQAAAAAARKTQNQIQSQSGVGPPSSTQHRPPRLRTHHTTSNTPDQHSPPERSPKRVSRSEPTSAVSSALPSPLQSPQESQFDPFDVFPQEWRASIPAVMDYYVTYLATANVYTDGEGGTNLLRRTWLPFVLHHPVLLSAVVLLAATHLSSSTDGHEMRQQQAHQRYHPHGIDTITLRGMVIRGINDTIRVQDSSLSDELFGTILIMATFEVLFGDRVAYGMHMFGLQKLVELRGGLESLGLDGLLERFLLWTDCNASYLAGYDLFFPPSHFPTRRARPSPDPSSFYARRPPSTTRPAGPASLIPDGE